MPPDLSSRRINEPQITKAKLLIAVRNYVE